MAKSAMKLTIRDAVVADATEVARIAGEAYTQYVARMGKPPAPMIANFAQHIQADTVLLAETKTTGKAASTVVGFAIIIEKANGYWLENIAVGDGWRGRGVGKQLLAAAEKYLKGKTDSYQLYTNVAMAENIVWYKGLGFVETGRRTEAGYKRVYFRKGLV